MTERELRALSFLLGKYVKEHGDIGEADAFLLGTLGAVNGSLMVVQSTYRDTAYSDKPEPQARALWRTQYLIELLTEEPLGDVRLENVADWVRYGGVAGEFQEIGAEAVTPALMSGLLTAQGSDPGFLLNDEDGEVDATNKQRRYIDYDGEEDALTIRSDRLDPWLEARGYSRTGKDGDEWAVPTEDVAAIEAEVQRLNLKYGTNLQPSWV